MWNKNGKILGDLIGGLFSKNKKNDQNGMECWNLN